MSCDPIIVNFYPRTMNLLSLTVAVGTPFRVRVKNNGADSGEVIVDFDAAPPLTDTDDDYVWRPVGNLVYPTVARLATVVGEADLALTTSDVAIRAVCRGNPAGVPLDDSQKTISPVVVVV